MTTRESIYSNRMKNITRIALGTSDASLLRKNRYFRVTRNPRSRYHGKQCIKGENGPLSEFCQLVRFPKEQVCI